MDPSPLAARIEHTLLRLDAGPDDIAALCAQARRFAFHGVCVYEAHVPCAVERLQGSPVRVVSVADFPFGMASTVRRCLQVEALVSAGAHEIDVVLPMRPWQHGDLNAVQADLAAVIQAARPCPTKVILETAKLDPAQIQTAARLAAEAGAAFIKTSTGFATRGASVDDLRLMRAAVGPGVGLKASGGIRTRAHAEALITAGADRLGCSASVALVTEAAAAQHEADKERGAEKPHCA
ncbi:MAG: deoxyribose-phosphate aldolase [Polyangiales bacterium]